MRLILPLVALLAFSGCRNRPARVLSPPEPMETFEQMLLRTEGVDCNYVTSHADGERPSCRGIYDQFDRARQHYATVDARAREIRMAQFSYYRPSGVEVSGDAPRIAYGNGQWVQGYFFPPSLIVYAHERVVYCEALHGIALALGDAGWTDTGHKGPADKLQFECWRLVQAEWQVAQGR